LIILDIYVLQGSVVT